MPNSRVVRDTAKTLAQSEQSRRPNPEQSAESDLSAGQQHLGSSLEILLSDPRPSRSMFARQRATLVHQLQRKYGNHYVQRLVGHISERKNGGVQTKPAVTLADKNKDEREAERSAKQVIGIIPSPVQDSMPAQRQLGTNVPSQAHDEGVVTSRQKAVLDLRSAARGRIAIQRVLGPPYPFQGIITTRWNAALRRTASPRGRVIADLDRNTRVTAIGNTGNWLQVQVTIDGRVETGFVSQELVGNIPAAGFAPAVTAGGRVEVTDFGTYNVYPNGRRGALQPNEVYESEFQRLQTAWRRVGDNSGGLLTHGAAGDVATMRDMLGRGMANSQTFRNLIVEITEDAAHPVTINVGRNNAYWVDEFATNRVDLTDTEFFDEAPRPGYEWASTQGELIVHWLAERRHAAVQGGGFAPAHAAPLSAGGLQEQYRADIGQAGRIVSQVRVGPAGGLHAGVYTDDSGNIMRIRRDGSGGNPVPYEIRYEPAGGGAVDTRRNNIVASVRSTRASGELLYLKFTNAGHDVDSPVRPVAAGLPLNFTTPLGGIVPTGASVDVELYKKGWWITSDTLLGTLTWAHPFTRSSTLVTVGGIDYTITSDLVMEP